MEDDDEKDDAKFLATIRQVVGGLLLPTIAVSLDKLVLSHVFPSSNGGHGSSGSTIFRTVIVRQTLFMFVVLWSNSGLSFINVFSFIKGCSRLHRSQGFCQDVSDPSQKLATG